MWNLGFEITGLRVQGLGFRGIRMLETIRLQVTWTLGYDKTVRKRACGHEAVSDVRLQHAIFLERSVLGGTSWFGVSA